MEGSAGRLRMTAIDVYPQRVLRIECHWYLPREVGELVVWYC
jgi:hypothetical protein